VNAGLGVQVSRLRNLVRTSPVLLAGLAANVLVPVAFIFGVAQALRPWHEPDEAQNLLVGLALIAAMPVAGSSTAWSQNGNGDMALSLGLVLLTTLLSPATTPLAQGERTRFRKPRIGKGLRHKGDCRSISRSP